MKLISFDVGIKNLAYCIVDDTNNSSMKILKWDIIDLLNINNKCSFCDKNANTLFYKYKMCKDHKNIKGIFLVLEAISASFCKIKIS